MRKTILLMALILACCEFAAAQTENPAKKDTASVRRDDALPDGAIARLGTLRFRHDGAVRRVAYAAGGKVIVSTSDPGRGMLWDAKSGQLLHKLPYPEFRFSESLAISPDGKKFVTCLALVDVESGKEIRRFNSPKNMFSSAAFSCDGRIFAHSSHSKTIVLFDADNGNELRKVESPEKTINAVAFSPTDKHILASAGYDTTVRLWNADNGKQLHQLDGHGAPVQCVAFAPDGKLLASGDRSGTVRLWDVAAGKQHHRLLTDNGLLFDLVFSPSGKRLACTGYGGCISLWDPEAGKKIRQWQTPFSSISSLAFAPDGKTLASAGGTAICFWEVETGKEINPLPNHVSAIRWLRFNKQRNSLSTCDNSAQVIEWDIKSLRPTIRSFSGEVMPTPTEAWSVRDVSSDGKLVVQTSNNLAPRLWDVISGKTVHNFEGRAVPCLLSPNGKTLASGGADGVRLWDVVSGKVLHQLVDKRGFAPLVFSPDSKEFVSRTPDNMVQHWDVATGKESRRWNAGKDLLKRLTFSPDGKTMAVSFFPPRGTFVTQLRAADTGKEIHDLSAKFVADELVFSPNGRIVACGGQGKVQLIEARTGQEIRVFEASQPLHEFYLAFAPDGATLATGGPDSTVLLWDLTKFAHSKPAPLTAQMVEAAWTDLQADAAKADRAHWTLAQSPRESLPFLKKAMKPAPPVQAERLAKLVADLESGTFEVRQRADRDLVALGASAESALRKKIEKGPSLELRRRIELILEKCDRDPEVLRQLRAIDILEQIGTPPASEILATFAKTTSTPRVAQAAEAAMERLKRQ